VKTDRQKLRELLDVVLATAPEEIDCDEFLARVSTCLEALGPGDEIPGQFDAVAQHLTICGECREEYQTLLEIFRQRAG
jgi:hypothetical protein